MQPYVLVLGTAQDGGLPQIGCDGAACQRARNDAGHARLVTSLLLVDPRSGKRYLFDATPDLPAQVERMREHPPERAGTGLRVHRPRIVDGIFLTHAHMGHYTGLSFLGPEAYGASEVPVYGSPRMNSFLRANGPWSFLVEKETLQLIDLDLNRPVQLGPDLSVETILVPHREELSDTVAFIIHGPTRSLLYLPDIDKWERWDTRIEDVLARVDVALLDASFFGPGEIPGRILSEIPHPFLVESLERFQSLPPAERAKIRFTHLNHTNPAVDPLSAESGQVRAAGMAVAMDGEVHALGAE